MKSVNGKIWRNSASLILLSKRYRDFVSCRSGSVNYDVLLQTRAVSASFPNSVVFPGGVAEPVDENVDWLHHLQSFGYTQNDFNAFHLANTPSTPIFQPDPIKRHISLRITAIRETFEELGVLICSRTHKGKKTQLSADLISDIDIKSWQKKVSSNPEELLNLCKEHKCYPDIWSLHFWSNWLSPVALPKRFDTAFFVAALDNEIPQISNNSEVTDVKWSSPQEILEKNLRKELELYPPQAYELNRLIHFSDIDVLVKYAAERSSSGCELIYPVVVEAKDGKIHVLPGDDLYPLNVNYKEGANILHPEKTILELRENCHMLHRLEITSLKEFKTEFVFRNHHPPDHINMGDKIISVNSTLHKNVK
ncbi:unnamed protein product [Chilo suppressalis]|uniref:Nudix hydrolase domain-containing protein n=1 Tax=Chilo suppressalis TaxID=168631 RepID=A0ABN8B9C2_CHISP|nr:hypothetical protein evm_003412 [Chilo suppressalis]CAH0405182.1 unnamed protein product [Chilo suppressalis]